MVLGISGDNKSGMSLKTAALTVVVVVAFAGIIDYAQWLGLFMVPKFNHAPGPCVRLHGIEFGAEDIQVMPNGLAFISSGIQYKNVVGHIYLFDFNQPDVSPRELPIIADANYQLISPHGISIWIDDDKRAVYLYVVSHVPFESVDKFRFDEQAGTLTHLRRFANHSDFRNLNDVVAVGEDKFYFTNSYYKYQLEILLRGLRWGSVGYFDGETATLVETGLFIPNGAILSKDRRFLYVAAMGDEEIRAYSRNNIDNSLTFVNSIKVWSKVDNLNVDAETGDLWIGTAPVFYTAVQHLDDPRVRAPSQVLRIKLSDDQQPLSIDEVYSNDGSFIALASVAARHGRGLLIGSVSTNAVYCDIKYIDHDNL